MHPIFLACLKGANHDSKQRILMLNLLEKLTDPPSGGSLQKWIAGVVLPLGLLAYSLSCVIYGYATLIYSQSRHVQSIAKNIQFVSITGPSLGWFLALILATAAYCHFHWYWGNDRTLGRYYESCQLITLAILVPLLIWNVLRALIFS